MNATLTRTNPEVIVLGMYAGEQEAVLIDGVAYWVRDTGAGWEFTREDTQAVYTVPTYKGTGTACQCKDRKYRNRVCKHMLAAAELSARLW